MRPDTRLPVDVRGDLCLVGPSGRRVTLEASDAELRLAVPGWAELKELGPRSLLSQRRALAATLRLLKQLSLTLEIAVDGHRAIAMGPGVRTSLPARLLGLASADIRLGTVLRFLRSRAAAR